MAHGPSHSVACGIFLDRGTNLCPLHWQADFQPLHHQGSLEPSFFVHLEHVALSIAEAGKWPSILLRQGREKRDEQGIPVLKCLSLEVKQYLYFKLDLQEDDFIELLAVQHKKLTNEELMELEAQRKDEERQEEEEVTEEPKRFTAQERGFSSFEEALLVFEAQDPNIERYTKVIAAIQNAIQCYHVIYNEKKRATSQTSLDRFFRRADRIESSKEPEPVPSMSGMSAIASCPPYPVADDPSALPSPTSSPSSSQ
ncbi:tigger transposable element-derived protein 1-like isoform X1 [Physeter macrocephalus]|uniref:Tigger transposable element-derived protein 1-like isoform X1 n=1 Tax=Physeter macrocephalus TaxID=9755 RepID=A0A9W2WU42_PHYMC|nr:tigger transposable element-derived protein 1-like isoform X1 [Physeter catodon]XP_054942658.1 tigger transposable element-derived protein 1-like isoform X1 [Physeter catodon]XP_054942659.1 tigger transposable element-derived protein 1-like isoform X1 [Physeter catodon]XP_054942660.1 tigger transposable element-derived protein 1-like isoform X1 [Physeter catodon]XP_054942661.1 tigger transposable element-derived protein 1-like isoform X1 [Physeter catodon]XP_054942662.1 tigger transposable 